MQSKNTIVKSLEIKTLLLAIAVGLLAFNTPKIERRAAHEAAYQIEELLLNQQGTSHEKETVKAINHLVRWQDVLRLGEGNK